MLKLEIQTFIKKILRIKNFSDINAQKKSFNRNFTKNPEFKNFKCSQIAQKESKPFENCTSVIQFYEKIQVFGENV